MNDNNTKHIDADGTGGQTTEKAAEKTTEEILREAGLDPDAEDLPAVVAKLYPFQAKNILSVRSRQTAMLAWQMGSGKTFGAGALAEIWKDPILVVLGPKSVVDQWVAFLQAETERTVYNAYTPGGLDDFLADEAGHKALCTSDDAFKLDSHKELRRYINAHATSVTMICDESSRLGDPGTKRTKAVLRTKTAHKILLSGTPATSGKMEKLIPAMRMMGWPIAKDEFLNNFCITVDFHAPSGRVIRTIKGYKNINGLRKGLIAHGTSFLTMEEAGVTLPEAAEQTLPCTPPSGYQKFMKYGVTTIEGHKIIGDMAIVKLTRARQICGILCKDKVSRVRDLLEAAEGERVVIFYNFKAEHDILRKLCEDMGRPVSFVNGTGKNLEAYEAVPDAVTLLQYQSGSMGLNLQKARICIFYTPCLSYSDFEQAQARVHRIGQGKNCIFYKLVCRESVEERIYKSLEDHGEYTAKLFAQEYNLDEYSVEALKAFEREQARKEA